jgi:hypothetical protein
MGDDAQYILHARALAEGRDYTDIGYIYTLHNPIVAPVAYPPGGPLLMAPLFRHLDDPISAARVVALFLSACFVSFAGIWAVREFGPWIAFGAMLMVATNPGIVGSASRLLSDLPFCSLLWGVLALSTGAGRWPPLRLAIITLFGTGAILFRTAGVALVPALIGHVWLQRPERRRAGLVPIAVWTATFATTNLVLPTVSSYTDQISWDLPNYVRNLARAALRYRLALVDAFHEPFAGSVADDLYHIGATAFAIAGFLFWIRRNGRDLAVTWGLVYVAMLLSYTTHTTRFAWPLFPPLLCFALAGFGAAIRRVSRPSSRLAAIACLVLATAVVLPGIGKLIAVPPLQDFVDRTDVRELFVHVLRRSEEREIRASFFNPRVLTLRTGVPAMGIFDAPPDAVLNELCMQGITDVILGDVRPVRDKDRAFRGAVEAYRARFALEMKNESFEVWRLDRVGACGGGS